MAAGRTWHYGELDEAARRGGAHLLQYRPSDMVALAAGSLELAFATLAASAAGLAFLPMDPRTAEQRWPLLQALGGPGLRRMAPLPGNWSGECLPAPRDTSPDASALIIATSGSEGPPKAVVLSHANLDAAAAASNERLPLAPGDVWLDCLPLFHVGGMAILHRAFRAGTAVLLADGGDAQAVWRGLFEPGVTHVSLVPAMLARLLEVSDGPPPSSLRFALIGGAALSRPLFEQARARGWPLCPSYGLSECAAQVATLVRPDTWREGAVGRPLSGFDVRIGADRRIALRGPQRMLGYLEAGRPRPGPTDGWFVTSDLGEMDADGSLTVLGRADDMFVSGGENVHPVRVESCLAACPGVADVAVTALPDLVWGDRLVALVVGEAEPETVRQWGCLRLASAERPREVLRVERLPRNLLGKLERALLPALVHGK